MSDTTALSVKQPAPETGITLSLGGLELRLDQDFRSETTEYAFAGLLTGGHVERFLGGGSLLIQNQTTGLAWEVFFGSDGRFSQALELAPDSDSQFVVALCDGHGKIAATVPVAIRHRGTNSSTGQAEQSIPTAPRALSVEVREPNGKRRRHVLVPAGASLPGRFACVCRTTDQCGRVIVPLWEESRLVHQLIVAEIDPQMPVGVAVNVELEVQADRAMTLRVLVRPAGRGEVVQLPALAPPGTPSAEEQHRQTELVRLLVGYPPVQRLTQLVKRCLFEAANLADRTGHDRQQLFAQIYAQEQAAEQAHAENDARRYRESFDNLQALAADFERLQWEMLPMKGREAERLPTLHDVADALKDLQTYVAAVLPAAELVGKAEFAKLLRVLDGQRQELADRAKRDPRAALRDVRRAVAEVAGIEQTLTGGLLGTSAAVEGLVELSPPGAAHDRARGSI